MQMTLSQLATMCVFRQLLSRRQQNNQTINFKQDGNFQHESILKNSSQPTAALLFILYRKIMTFSRPEFNN
jgi:hypothetical protein